MTSNNSNSVGIFDSGVGGLTVAKSLVKLLPNENVIYFGDTANFPYGEKSKETLQLYSTQITEMLLKHNCKLILIACNSASATAYEILQNKFGNKSLIVNVVDPVTDFVYKNYKNQTTGLIGTRQTVNSAVYSEKIHEIDKSIILKSLAIPLLAPAIEENFSNNKIIDALIEEYLSRPILNDINALILACTHYPIIKNRITKFYNDKLDIIDGSDIVARFVKQLLAEKGLLNNQKNIGTKHFYSSYLSDSFISKTKLFFGHEIDLEYYEL